MELSLQEIFEEIIIMKFISTMIEAHVFRESVNGIEFLLLKRAENQVYPGLWQMVTGKIEDNEKAYQTAIREIKEETGLTPLQLWVAPTINFTNQRMNIYACCLFLPQELVLIK